MPHYLMLRNVLALINHLLYYYDSAGCDLSNPALRYRCKRVGLLLGGKRCPFDCEQPISEMRSHIRVCRLSFVED